MFSAQAYNDNALLGCREMEYEGLRAGERHGGGVTSMGHFEPLQSSKEK